MYDLVLSNGLVYDGLGNSPVTADIGIKNEKISAIGDLSKDSASQKINVKNLSICPGFIDMHSHSDVNYFLDPHAECKIRQGVTTEVIGNCGGSAAPLYGQFRARRQKEWKTLGIKIKWNNFKEYVDILTDQGVGVNVVPIIGHGNIRGAIKGYSTTPVTGKELLKMKNLLSKSMEAGAFGISSGLIYIPGMYAGTKELIELVKIVSKFSGIYTTHMRSEGDKLIEAVKEAISIAEQSGTKLQISHLKTSGHKNWIKINELFRTIENAINNGINVSCDRYPYIASNTDLDVLLPNWFHEMSYKDKTYWINNRRTELADILKNNLEKHWQNTVMISKVNSKSNFTRRTYTHKNRTVTTNIYQWTEGKFLNIISKRLNTLPEITMLNLLKYADFQVQVMFFNMCEKNLLKILKKPYVMIGSDSSLRTLKGPLKFGHPHPRVFGTFPRVLSKYTGRGKLSIHKAIYKMTGLPAQKLGLRDRGIIRKDAYADIVVMDSKNIIDASTYEKPFQYPKGIEMVIVNGTIVLNRGIKTNNLHGKVLLNK